MARSRRPGGLVEQCLEQLRALPFVRRVQLASGPTDLREIDGALVIETPEGRETLPCEIRSSHLRHETAGALVGLAKRAPGLIVLSPSVGRELGDLFERSEVNFVDVAGNCCVRLGDRYIARVQGRTAPTPMAEDRGWRAAAYRVLFGFLARPELIDASSRAIAAELDLSPQTANDVRRRLTDRGLVTVVRGRRTWTPGRRKEAETLWLGGFAATLAPTLLIGRFRARERDLQEFERRIEPVLDATTEWRYGGGAAAMRLTGYYRGERTVLYLRDAPADLSAGLRLVRDPTGPILLAQSPGRPAFDSPHPRCVHPLLAYADLLSEGHDRARDAATELHERYLLPAEKA